MNFFLPDFYFNYSLNITLIELLKNHPEYFYDNIKIESLYGTFPGAIWNGGRTVLGITDQSNIQNTIQAINDHDIAVRFTYTNCFINKKHLNDYYCNLITEIGHNGKNEILVNSPILEEYLRNQYPHYKYILSTTKEIRDLNIINKLTDKYDLIVLDYRDNKNFDFLNKIEQKHKIELLINAYCDPNCTERTEHYKILSKAQLEYGTINADWGSCPKLKRSFQEALTLSSVYHLEDLHNILIPMGFTNFKIEGRNIHPYNVIDSYIYYLIKPEYKDIVRDQLVKSIWHY